MASSRFAGFEGLNDLVKDEVVANGDEMAADLFELMEADQAVTAAVEELNEKLMIFEDIEMAFAETQRLHDVVATEGLSRGLMAYADASGYLQEKFGLPSLESLDANPSNDANAQIVLEETKGLLKKWAEGIKKFFAMIVAQVKKIVTAVMQKLQGQEKVIKKLMEKMKSVKDFDGDKEVELYSIAALNELGSVLNKLSWDKADQLDEKSLKALGLKKSESGVEKTDSEMKKEKGTLKKLGYTPSTAEVLLKNAATFLGNAKQMQGTIKATEAIAKAGLDKAKVAEKVEGEAAAEAKKEAEAEVKKAKVVTKILNAAIKAAGILASGAIAGANAVASASKKEEKSDDKDEK